METARWDVLLLQCWPKQLIRIRSAEYNRGDPTAIAYLYIRLFDHPSYYCVADPYIANVTTTVVLIASGADW